MSYKTISIVITDQIGDATALSAAIGLCEQGRAHLEVFCLGVDQTHCDATPLGATPALSIAGAHEAVGRSSELETWAEDQLRNVDFPVSVHPLTVTSMGLDAAIARRARYCDLIVASQPYGPGTTQLQVSVLEAALFGTGAPVLVIPRTDHDYRKPFDRLMVAWNETDEALEAVRKAMPTIADADRADIVMIDPGVHSAERSDPGGAICVMMARHGVKVEVSVLSKTLPRVAEVMNRHAKDQNKDLIVMGAYGHSRFREAIMGGATRDMLETTQLPIMMAH